MNATTKLLSTTNLRRTKILCLAFVINPLSATTTTMIHTLTDTKVYVTRDNENSYVVQLGDPIFDVSDTEEEGEIFYFDPIFDVSEQDNT